MLRKKRIKIENKRKGGTRRNTRRRREREKLYFSQDKMGDEMSTYAVRVEEGSGEECCLGIFGEDGVEWIHLAQNRDSGGRL
jgi:hypothetical protein